MRITCFLVILLAHGTSAAAACPWEPSFVSASAKPLPPAAFNGVSAEMPVAQIIRRLGPAARDAGSGLHVLEWDVTDGRSFRVSAASACGKPLAAGFRADRP